MNKEQFKRDYSRVRFMISAAAKFGWDVSKGNYSVFSDAHQSMLKDAQKLYPYAVTVFLTRRNRLTRYELMEIWTTDRKFTKTALWANSRS